MKKLITIDFCDLEIHDNYLIVTMNEGITILPNHNEILLDIVETYYKDKNFVYITNCLNSYAVDPSIYFKTGKIDNLKGFAVVYKDYRAKGNAEVEKLFLNKPFGIFKQLDEAVVWANSLLT
ncbi:hypothetical protein NA63_2338 [Flavobacteriaceae bacterium MAR_2010_105]|nr:hypothetical protein NA63_2338 [Flavobacteriaceae bacterium MAR_2010_105]